MVQGWTVRWVGKTGLFLSVRILSYTALALWGLALSWRGRAFWVVVVGCLLLISWTTVGKMASARHDPVMVLLAGKTSTATGPWWLKTW